MARKSSGVNKSEEVRQLLKADPALKAKQVVSILAERGVTITESLVYFIKGRLHNKKARKQKATAMIASVAEATGTPDPLAAILKIKRLAIELGGMKKLRALVEALSD